MAKQACNSWNVEGQAYLVFEAGMDEKVIGGWMIMFGFCRNSFSFFLFSLK